MNSDNSKRNTEAETATLEDSGHKSCANCGRQGNADNQMRTLSCGNTFCQQCFDTLDKLTDGPREVLCGCDDCNTYQQALGNDDTGGPPPSEDDTGGPLPSENDDTGGPPPSPTPTDVSARVSFPLHPTSTPPKPKKRSKNCEIHYPPGGSWPR